MQAVEVDAQRHGTLIGSHALTTWLLPPFGSCVWLWLCHSKCAALNTPASWVACSPTCRSVPTSRRRLTSIWTRVPTELCRMPSASLYYRWGPYIASLMPLVGSVAEWLACWTQTQKARVQIAAATLSGNSLRQTVHTHRASASVHQAAKLVAALLRVAE